MAEKPDDSILLGLTAQIVAAYSANNELAAGSLAGAVRAVYDALANIGAPPPPPAEKIQPAVPVRKSVFPDYIICLEDGKKLKMLKRYLRSRYSLSPEEYRTKWGLPADYPMVAPNYAQQRSDFAKKIGLGRSAPASKGRRRN